ncbi:hypothetical protein EXIGLDRAFT_774375 [Exidia glandulosa HHB12029]|uniref:Uncharacterized protein n=1 Tax=Exidia glandulosa HHB12029 TaxID=1314781 RepID=A0A165EDG7_EXIGL|nr:hypothetical protein EXIGLDRAFT_774375 [Exidia glandulosa HHB12029]
MSIMLAHPHCHAGQKFALRQSHGAGLARMARIPKEYTQLREEAFLEYVYVRFDNAPFLDSNYAIQLTDELRYSAEMVFARWIESIPTQLVRLGTEWERKMFVREKIQADAAHQLRLVEEYLARKHPEFLEQVDTRRALLCAYGATRAAPDDAARQWDVLRSRGEGITSRVLDAALAAARTLNNLHAVWTQIRSLPLAPTSRTISWPSLQTSYALHIARLGAHDETAKLAAVRDVRESIECFVGQPTSPEAIQRRTIADTLKTNGLDAEDVLWMLSEYSPYREFLLVQGKSEPTPAEQ